MEDTNAKLWAARVWGAILLAVASGLFGIAAEFARPQHRLATIGVATPGVVADVVGRGGGRKGPVYYPLVRFTDSLGRSRQFVGTIGTKPSSYERGERVTVIYDPADPTDAMIDSFIDRYLATIALCLFGSVWALMGGWLLLGARQR
ncbi:hypothetical protein C0V72_12280 [Porphyrobacter sp. TH134]|uniref:DUF3592 domain-containing protein n=1 Tax=Porphyrobacter sp. TH134 TaxID=2067450 RepID=UPI000C7976FF|nr:DUF3592 domain-containing protein [Porphyrobacter sp. TH134]PLK22903.1 hypothetical protein C0V72_12280 [Porphyrobacter sp. TH134]